MKNGNGIVLRNGERVRERWKKYFVGLLNEEYLTEHHINGRLNEGLTRGGKRGGGERT